MNNDHDSTSEIILYQTDDGRTRLEVQLQDDTVWLTQAQMAELFQTSVPNINIHLRNLFAENELRPDSVIKESLTTAADGKGYLTKFYNLDVIISVGYRVKSQRGTQFRIWATQRLREYLIKGFTMDDDRLKRLGGGQYFDELLARIRDIRSSEKIFWRKVLDIYATSVDYDPDQRASQKFFATMQNKMHWAAHGHTAAEVIAERADAAQPNMGLTTWAGFRPQKADAGVAKNYLDEAELAALNLIVSMYLDFAELQALNRRAMHMVEWIAKLDDFLRLGERDILTHAGNISHEAAQAKVDIDFKKFRAQETAKPSRGERDFEAAIAKANQIESSKPQKKTRRRK